jgi:hypothetical protein
MWRVKHDRYYVFIAQRLIAGKALQPTREADIVETMSKFDHNVSTPDKLIYKRGGASPIR